MQPGIYDNWPRLVIPEIERDTSFSVTVRAFAEDQVMEKAFTVMVQNTSGPAEFGIECNPVHREVYEGDSAFDIVCNAIDSPTDELSWTWSAEGETPLELLEPGLTSENLGTATFSVPEEVTEDTFYGYTVTATHADAGTSNRVSISDNGSGKTGHCCGLRGCSGSYRRSTTAAHVHSQQFKGDPFELPVAMDAKRSGFRILRWRRRYLRSRRTSKN